MKRTTVLMACIALVLSFQNFSSTSAPASPELQFTIGLNSRLALQAARPFPKVKSEPFWGTLNQSISQAAMSGAFDEKELIEQIRIALAPLQTSEDPGRIAPDLQFPLMTRAYFVGLGRSKFSKRILSPEGEEQLNSIFFDMMNRMAIVMPYDTSGAEFVGSTGGASYKWLMDSENHRFSQQTTYLLLAQALKSTAYAGRKLGNGLTVSENYERWSKHWKVLLEDRIRYGLLIEVGAPTYTKYTFSAILNLIDFAEDASIRRQSTNLADLILATAADETIPNGIRGGAKSRKHAQEFAEDDGTGHIFKLFFTNDRSVANTSLAPMYLTTSYYPPPTVFKLWKKASEQKSYEVNWRVPGVLAKDTRDVRPQDAVFHYTYMTPDYVLGSSLLNRQLTYASISSESRSMTLAVNDVGADGAAPFINFGPGDGQCFDRVIGAQKRNVLIYQKNFAQYVNGLDRCLGVAASGQQQTWPVTRTLSNGKSMTYNYVRADRMNSPKDGSDVTRNHVDMTFTKNFSVQLAEGALVFTSPNKRVYVWVKPVRGTFALKDYYNKETHALDSSVALTDAYLTTDPFSPVVVVTTSAANYKNNLSKFISEMAYLNELTLDKNKVIFEPSLRSQLEPDDVMADLSNAVVSDGWRPVPGRAAHSPQAGIEVVNAGKAKVTYSVQIPKTGEYDVKLRLIHRKLNQAMNFDVQIDGGVVRPMTGNARKGSWFWYDVNASDAGSRIKLAEGKHQITFVGKTEATYVDAVVFLNRNTGSRLAGPDKVIYFENTDNGSQDSVINNIPAQQSPKFLSATYDSANIYSARDSGVWDVRAEDSGMVIRSGVFGKATGEKIEGTLLRLQDADGLTVGDRGVDEAGTAFVRMNPKTSFRLNAKVQKQGAYAVFARTRARDGNADSAFVRSGNSTIPWHVPQSQEWSWNYGKNKAGGILQIELNVGDNDFAVDFRENGLEIEALMLVPVN